MKNISGIILLTSLIVLAGCRTNKITEPDLTTVKLEKGYISVQNFGDRKIHAFFTDDLMKDWVIVLEKDGRAVLIESPAFTDNFAEFAGYLTDNNIRVEGIIPSYHPLGAALMAEKALADSEVYMTVSTIDYWDHGFGAVMKEGIPVAFGDKNIDETFYNPTIMLEEGETEIAGIRMILTNSYDGFDIEIPEFNAVYMHILGHDVHSEILSYEHLDSSITHMKRYQSKGYETFLSSHYGPETNDDALTKIAYLKDMRVIAAGSETAEDFITNMKAAYPDYQEGYLMASAQMLFSNK